jgi:hypothetical protein
MEAGYHGQQPKNASKYGAVVVLEGPQYTKRQGRA